MESDEMMKSWTLIKSSEKKEISEGVEICPESNQSEESDGISVISESEICKHLANESENDVEKTSSEVEEEKIENFQEDFMLQDELDQLLLPPSPPLTPRIDDIMENLQEYSSSTINSNVNLSKALLIGAGIFVLLSFLYSQLNQLKLEITNLDQRIVQLENQNQVLKESLKKIKGNLIIPGNPKNIVENLKLFDFASEIVVPVEQPPLKSVWLGNEEENKVEILGKHDKLPDYCYFTDKDDLFYEYNLENCDRKKRKLEEKKRKRKPKLNYDDLIQETLRSLNDEIQEIKKKRGGTQNDEIIHVATDFQLLEKTSEEIPKRNRRKKIRKEKESRNWIQDRVTGREELRKKTIEEQEYGQNWYLKRKLERELDRLEI